jgi:hypothetical protein
MHCLSCGWVLIDLNDEFPLYASDGTNPDAVSYTPGPTTLSSFSSPSTAAAALENPTPTTGATSAASVPGFAVFLLVFLLL